MMYQNQIITDCYLSRELRTLGIYLSQDYGIVQRLVLFRLY